MFFKRAPQTMNYRRQEAAVLVFLAVSFFIYGLLSFQFYMVPERDPFRFTTMTSSRTTLIIAGLFLLYGGYVVAMRRSAAGRLFGVVIAAESLVVACRQLLFSDVSTTAMRLSGTIEGAVCFSVFVALLLVQRKGASIFY